MLKLLIGDELNHCWELETPVARVTVTMGIMDVKPRNGRVCPTYLEVFLAYPPLTLLEEESQTTRRKEAKVWTKFSNSKCNNNPMSILWLLDVLRPSLWQ